MTSAPHLFQVPGTYTTLRRFHPKQQKIFEDRGPVIVQQVSVFGYQPPHKHRGLRSGDA